MQRSSSSRRLLLVALSSFLMAVPLLSQQGGPDSSDSFNPIGRGLKDLWIQAKAPFSISSEDAPWVVAGAVSFGGFLLADQPIYDRVNPPSLEGTTTGRLSQTVTSFGASYGVIFLAGFTGYGFLAENDKALETSYLAAEAFVTSGIWTQLFKALSGRERPSVRTRAGGAWTGPFGSSFKRHFTDYDSFSSGHTSTAFSIATVFAGQYSDTPVVPVLSYGLAGLVGLSRITVNRHWPSDVFAGALVGYLCARQVLAHNPSEVSRSHNRFESSWLLIPQSNGFSLVVRF